MKEFNMVSRDQSKKPSETEMWVATDMLDRWQLERDTYKNGELVYPIRWCVTAKKKLKSQPKIKPTITKSVVTVKARPTVTVTVKCQSRDGCERDALSPEEILDYDEATNLHYENCDLFQKLFQTPQQLNALNIILVRYEEKAPYLNCCGAL